MKETPWERTQSSRVYTLKPTKIPEGFTLIQDTREQRPLFPRIPKGLTILSATLSDGDYSIKGFESVFAFERKAMDIFPYCSSEREKTVAKMKRFKSMEYVGLAIELRESELYQFQQHSRVHPEVVRAAITSFQVRYNVHVYFGNRETCARHLLDIAVKFWNVKHEIQGQPR